MSKIQFAGFCVVFKAEVYLQDPPPYPHVYPLKRLYRGYERNEWYRASTLRWETNPSEEILAAYNSLHRDERQYRQWKGYMRLAPSIECIHDFYDRYLGGLQDDEEIIAVGSPSLNEIFGTTPFPGNCQFLGYDLRVLGEWSLLCEGYSMKPHLFESFHSLFNEHSLFDRDDVDLGAFLEHYQALTATDTLEPFYDEWLENLEFIAVAQVPKV